MLGMSMMLGGRPTYLVRFELNRGRWRLSVDEPSIPLTRGPINLYVMLSTGITVSSDTEFLPAIYFDTLPDYSDVFLINAGIIQGASGSGLKADGRGVAVWLTGNGGNLYIDNGSGYIYGGTVSDGVGYAVKIGGTSTLRWISGAGRITGGTSP